MPTANPPGIAARATNGWAKLRHDAIAGLTVAAIAAPLISPYDPIVQHQGKELLGPNSAFWLGTDELGRDLLSRVIYGARPSLIVALMVVVLGGGVMEALADEMTAVIVKTAKEHAMPGTLKNVEIVASKLGDNAGITGAAVLAKKEAR